MHHLLKNFHLYRFLYLLPLLLLTQCDKEPAINNNIDGTFLNVTDSATIQAYSVACQNTDTKNTGDVPMGILRDNRYGNSEASFYAQLRLTTNSYDLGNNAVLDSAVLHLKLNGKYGPCSEAMNIEVYRLEDDLVSTNTYTQDVNLNVNATKIASLNNFVYDENESYISIPLTAAISTELFGLFGTANMDNSDNFLDYFKGIYVKINSASGGDGHVILNLTDEKTAMKLYFHSDAASDSVYNFLMDAQSIRVNKYVHDYSGSLLEQAFNDDTNNDDVIYLGGLNTSRAFIKVPDLSFLQGNIINYAKLSFYQADYGSADNDGYELPNFLFLSGYIDNDSLQYALTDYSSSYPTNYGGLQELVDVNGSPTYAYSYYLPKFFQKVVNQTTNISTLGLEILDPNRGTRIALGGGTNPDFGIKLEIIYTN